MKPECLVREDGSVVLTPTGFGLFVVEVIGLDEVGAVEMIPKIVAFRERVAQRRTALRACGLADDNRTAIHSLLPHTRIAAGHKADRKFDLMGAVLAANEPLQLQKRPAGGA